MSDGIDAWTDLNEQGGTEADPDPCTCECHGPVAGFYHCFGPPCCSEPDVPRATKIP